MLLLIFLGAAFSAVNRKTTRANAARTTSAPAPSTPPALAMAFSKVDSGNVRAQPNENALVVRKLRFGERLIVIERQGMWARLKAAQPEWVHSTLIADSPPEDPQTLRTRLAEQRTTEVANRRKYADLLRERFLDAGFDIEVRVSGANADRLLFEYVFFGDVWSHRFRKDGIVDQAKVMGFKRLDMTDGHNWHVYWDLK